MAVFKSLSPDDVSRVPFNANKQFTFNSSSASTVGITTDSFEYTSSVLDTFSSASTDSKNTIKYYQLDHLFYREQRRDVSNKLGDADYLGESRILYDKVNVISFPSNLYGNKIKPGNFIFSSSAGTIIDDSKGNLIISGTNLISHSVDEREKVFFMGPVKGFKQYNLNYDLYGKVSPNPNLHYNRKKVYDDSYYSNTLDYKKIKFKKEHLGPDLLTQNGFQTVFDENANGWELIGTNVSSNFTATGGIKITTTGAGGGQFAQFFAPLPIGILKPFAKYRLEFEIISNTGTSGPKAFVVMDGFNASRPFGTPRVQVGKNVVDFQYVPPSQNGVSNNATFLSAKSTDFPNAGKAIVHFEFTNANTQAYETVIKNCFFREIMDYPTANFDSSVSSSIVAPHNETYNFNPGEDFTIAMHVNPAEANSYLLSKSTTKTIIKSAINEQTYATGSSQPFNIKAESRFPFEIFINNEQQLIFRKSDGNFTPTISASINTGSVQHIVCMSSASQMEIWITGSKIASVTDTTATQTENKANLYIGSKGEIGNYYTGSLANVMIFNSSRTKAQIESLHSSSNGLPYVGNIFYSNGLATITHPNHMAIGATFESGSVRAQNPYVLSFNNINLGPNPNFVESRDTNSSGSSAYSIRFKNIHPIYENEYMCTINADEYNFTHNISTRKIKSDQKADLANFATGSLWKPYVTTVGLYNEDNELLVVGKLAQPVRMSDEADTTFALRWDT